MTTTTHESELLGRRLGVFRLDAPLGRGGMGAVYQAFDTNLERQVAVKVLAPALAADPGFVQRFVREARTAARLNHPNVVQIYGAAFENGVAYMALELVTGGSLAGVAAEVRPFPLRRACEVVLDITRGLAAAHALGIVHRDLKPDNVLLTPEGQVKLADFGLARSVVSQRITQSGTFLGTPQYCSPEQCNGAEVGFPSDLYSLGVVFYELLAGRPPHEAPTPLALFKKILVEETPSIAELRSEVPPSLAAVLSRLLQKEPAARYPSADALAADLERVLARLPADAAGAASFKDALAATPPQTITEADGPSPEHTAETTPARKPSPFEESVAPGRIAFESSVLTPIVQPLAREVRDAGPSPAAPSPAAPSPAAPSPDPIPSTPPAPRARHRAAIAVCVAAVALVASILAATPFLGAPPRRPARIAVLEWKNGAGSDDFAWLADAVPEFVESELSAVQALKLLDRRAAIASNDPMRGADLWVVGTFYEVPSGTDVVITAEVMGPDGTRYRRPPRPFPRENVLAEMSALARDLATALDGAWIEEAPAPADRLVASARSREEVRAKTPAPASSAPASPPPVPASPPPVPASPSPALASSPAEGLTEDDEIATLDQRAANAGPAAPSEAERPGSPAQAPSGRSEGGRAPVAAKGRDVSLPGASAPEVAPTSAATESPAMDPFPTTPSRPLGRPEDSLVLAESLVERLRAARTRSAQGWEVGTLLTSALTSNDVATLEEALLLARSVPQAAPLARRLETRLAQER